MAHRGRLLSKALLAGALAQFVEAPVPENIGLRDYHLCRCPACTLEFADPPEPAGDAFYAWLDREQQYYVGRRWEWDRVEERVRAHRGSPTVLEIGAGDGRFLQRLRNAGAITVAIERSDAAAAALREKGVEAHAQDRAGVALFGRRFDFVLAFHCLEHVVDPVGLVNTMLGHAGAAGRVLFSVPYSPMYFETSWFDPLNHPPHHMTRWNARALAELAAACGRRASLTLPEPYSTVRRARYALAIRCLGPHWTRARHWRWLPLIHPLAFIAEWHRQHGREPVDGRPAADVVLAELLPVLASG